MPRNYMHPDDRGHGFHGRQGADIQRHLPDLYYTYVGRKIRARAKRDAAVDAKRITAIMKKTGRVEFADDRAEGVFEALVEIVHTKLNAGGKSFDPVTGEEKIVPPIYEHKAKDRIAAASKVLEFAQVKPVTKVENTIKAAEDWLASISDDDAQ